MKKSHAPVSSQAPIEDPGANEQFTRCACARWGAGILDHRQRLDRESLAFAFWICDGTGDERQRVLHTLLTPADRDRLGLEIKKAWSSPQELAYVVAAVLAGVHGPQMTRLTADVAAILREVGARQESYANCSLAANLANTRRLFGLDDQEVEICYFFTVLNWWEGAHDFFDSHLSCERSQGRTLLQAALGFGPRVMGRVLSGKLARIGILDFDRDWLSIESEFKPFFVDPAQAPVTQDLFRVLSGAELGPDDLNLDPVPVDHLRDLFATPGDQPLHVLLYGPPGTGKTTLARSLIQEIGLSGLDVLGMRDGGARGRRAALAACLEMASGQSGQVVVVDEADSLLGTRSPWPMGSDAPSKGLLNSVLEQPGLRAIWIVNSIEDIDAAVLRRFAYSLELPPLDQEMRAVMLEATLRRHRIKRHFDQAFIAQLAREFNLAPAVFEIAVATVCRLKQSPAKCRQALRRTLLAKAKLMGVTPRPVKRGDELPYMTDGINPDLALPTILKRVQAYDNIWRHEADDAHVPAMGLLFHGDPGTGKTQTAHHLAERLGRPVVCLRGSDLLDPYVGVTEQKMAAAFGQAAREGAVLILDEVDTFLMNRSPRSRSWEVSRVNELLTQIENHRGIIVCTTNRLDCLDGAALRRFALKVHFDFLQEDQVVTLYEQIFLKAVRSQLPADLAERLRGLKGVTCADLVLVRRNLMFLDGQGFGLSHAAIVAEIEREVALKQKPDLGRVIGF